MLQPCRFAQRFLCHHALLLTEGNLLVKMGDFDGYEAIKIIIEAEILSHSNRDESAIPQRYDKKRL
jgi:hypothetical protein